MFYNHLDENGLIVEEKVKLNSYREDLPQGHSYVPFVEPIESIKAGIVTKIKNIRDNKLVNGGYKVNGNWYHSDVFSRSQQLGLTIIGNNLPSIDWKTMKGDKIRLTPPLVQQIFYAAAAQDNAHFLYAEGLISQVYSSSAPESIDITQGWPETFEGI
jgi:hypothetical protein